MIGAGLVKRTACDLPPVYGTLMGLLVGFTVRLLFMTQLGSLLRQWPLGRLSDRADRRLVLVGLTACVCLTSLWIASGAAGTGVLLGFAITVWGACSLSTYAIGMAHAADHAADDEMVVVTSSALLAWGIGGMIGPAIAAPLLDLLRPRRLLPLRRRRQRCRHPVRPLAPGRARGPGGQARLRQRLGHQPAAGRARPVRPAVETRASKLSCRR